MSNSNLFPQKAYSSLLFIFVLFLLMSSGCKPEGLINKVKYKGETFTNTCESFSKDVVSLIQANRNAMKLDIAEYDNIDFDYYYLEPGQFDVKGDTVCFRLDKDLSYPKYLDKGVGISVHLRYRENEKFSTDAGDEKEISTLLINKSYYLAHRKPFFLYKFPLDGKSVAGKQLYLAFAVAKYNKKGALKKWFCNTDAEPQGGAEPACCQGVAWSNVQLKSIVDFPEVKIKDETFTQAGFTADFDVTFQEADFNYPDSVLALAVQSFVEKYKAMGYKVSAIDLKGYASPGGLESFNKTLSEQRAQNVRAGLEKLNPNTRITSAGMGEDWARVEQLTQKTTVLSAEQKDAVLAIIKLDEKNDKKEYKLRALPYWKQLKEEVFAKSRHTYITLIFDYAGEMATLGRVEGLMGLASQKLAEAARKQFKLSAYSSAKDIDKELATINQILTQKASANLYAMRSSYKLAQKDYQAAVKDLEKAGMMDKDNATYGQAVQGYKLLFADAYDADTRMAMYEQFNQMAEANPSDRKLFFNRAIIMDKVGNLETALEEYEKLMEGYTATATQLNNRGVARLKANMVSAAMSDFESAAKMDPSLAQPHFNLAAVYAWKGWTTKCLHALEQAIQIEPTYKDHIFSNPVFSVVSGDSRFDALKN